MNLNSKKTNYGIVLTSLMVSFAVFILSSPQVSQAQEKKDVYILCRNGKAIRTLKTQIGSDNVCRAMYNRDGGEEKLVGSGLNFDSCVGFLTKVRENLEKGGWKCREVKESATNLESPSSN